VPPCAGLAPSQSLPASARSGDASLTSSRRLRVPAEVVLLAANAVYGTAYVAMRPALDVMGPVTLAFLRLAIGSAILAPIGFGSRGAGAVALSRAEGRTLFWMGFLGFTLAMALGHWGLAWSTATNAALLIATEPIALIALAPLVLGSVSPRGRSRAVSSR
jgi:drug/metabolite transporter (DMT)-like permease